MTQEAGEVDQERSGVSLRTWAWFVRVWTLIGGLILLAVAWWVLREPVGIILAPIALAAVIVYLLNPLVGRAERRGIPRPVATLLAYLALAGGLVALGLAIGPTVADQTAELIDDAPDILAAVVEWVNDRLAAFGIDERLQVDFGGDGTRDAVVEFLRENREQVLSLLRGAGSVVGAIFHGLLTLILAPIIAFYVLADLPRITAGVTRLVPPGPRREVVDVTRRIGRTVGAYFRGQLLVATFVGVTTAIGLAIVGLPFWAIVGGLTGLFNLIPLVGPFVGGLVGVIIAVTVGDGTGQAIAVVIVMTAVQQVDNHVITPNIVSRTVEVHPVTVILGLLVAGTLWGIPGMLVAIPVIAAAKLVIVYLLVTRVPSMRHLAGEGALFDDDGEQPPEGTLAAMGRELRRAWERARGGGGDGGSGSATPRSPAQDPADGGPLGEPLPDREPGPRTS